MIWRWLKRRLIGDLEERVRHLEQAYEQLGKEVGRIENDLIRIITRIEKLEKPKERKSHEL